MECNTYQEHVSLWIDSQLTEDQIRQMEAHTATCASCRAYLDALRRLDRLLGAAPMLAPVPGFTERFQARLVSRRRRSRTWAGLLVLTLATLVLVLGSISLLATSGLALWGDLPTSMLLTQVTGVVLDLGKATLASLKLAWLILSALARGFQHPAVIAYIAATAILVALWTQIVTRRVLVRRAASAN